MKVKRKRRGVQGRLWYVYTDPTSGSQYVFDTSEVMHFKTSFSFDGVTGLPVQQILRDTISGASASQRYMNSLYESGLTAKATLEYTGELNDKAKEALVKSFEDFGSGARNTGKIIPVPLGMKLTPLDIKLSDSQLIEKIHCIADRSSVRCETESNQRLFKVVLCEQ